MSLNANLLIFFQSPMRGVVFFFNQRNRIQKDNNNLNNDNNNNNINININNNKKNKNNNNNHNDNNTIHLRNNVIRL